MNLTTHICPLLRVRMCKAVPPLSIHLEDTGSRWCGIVNLEKSNKKRREGRRIGAEG
jgi:hypothetical protein